MGFWDKVAAEFVDIIEWTDDTSDTMVWRFPRYDNEIKYGAQLVVRQSQAAVFVNMGKIADVFAPGQYSLNAKNLPVLSTLMGWAYGFHSPFKAEVYFVNTRNFTNLKWGTKNPVILRDPNFGPVRLRAFGSYVIRVRQPARFIEEIAGTSGHFTLGEVSDQLKNVVLTRLSDLLGESNIPVTELAARYNELSLRLTEKVAPEFLEYGLDVTKLLIENISLPLEVEAALDKKSSMGIIGNLEDFIKFQSANAMEAAAANPGGDASAGVGMGIGFAMANHMGKAMVAGHETPQPVTPTPSGKEVSYFVGKSGIRTGPFDQMTIEGQIRTGVIGKETLLWKEGMETWQPAIELHEFDFLLKTTPPPLPE